MWYNNTHTHYNITLFICQVWVHKYQNNCIPQENTVFATIRGLCYNMRDFRQLETIRERKKAMKAIAREILDDLSLNENVLHLRDEDRKVLKTALLLYEREG